MSGVLNKSAKNQGIVEKLKQYKDQLMYGCGKHTCNNPNCSSNPDPSKAFAKAILLLQENGKICRKYNPRALQYNEYRTLINNIENIDLELNRIQEAFSNLDALNWSFWEEDNLNLETDVQSSRINQTFLHEFCKFSNNTKHGVTLKDILKNLIAQILRQIVESKLYQQFQDSQDFRFIILLLHFPNILSLDSQEQQIQKDFFQITSQLSKEQRKTLSNWIGQLDKGLLEELVTQLHTAAIVDYFQNDFEQEIYNFDPLERTMSFFELVHQGWKTQQKLHYKIFQNDALSKEIDPLIQFRIFQLKKTEQTKNKLPFTFTFCDYPWILDSSCKQKILEMESKLEQREEQHAAFQNQSNNLLNFFMNPLEATSLILKVKRDNLIEDTLNQLQTTKINLKKPLRVQFVMELGVDQGGVKKEFFQLIIKELFDPNMGMFIHKNKDQYLWFNQHSFECPYNFELLGVVLGLAIYNSVLLDLHFPIVVYKKMLGYECTLEDILDLDPDLYHGFKQLLDFQGDVESSLSMTFQVTYESAFGEKLTYNLMENGDQIFVNNQNRNEYVNLYVDWILNSSVKTQFEAFKRGFYRVVQGDVINFFNAYEVHELICGSSFLDFKELEKITKYEDGYTKDSQAIKFFWEILHSFNEEQKKKFLFFCTGTDRAPIRGLSDLNFSISRHGPESDRLPSAHTCFNHLLLPDYSTKEKMQEKLLKAMMNAEGFGLH